MTVTAVVGANWGDEGKGKITDALAGNADYVVRFQGGRNAGHTIINSYGKFALHLLPSGVFYPHVTNVIGPGVAFDAEAFFREKSELVEKGVPEPALRISDRAELVMPYHKLFDELEEERLATRSFGSTRQGIAPFYADKYAKLGVQIGDLFEESRLYSRISAALETKNVLLRHLYGREPLQADSIAEQLAAIAIRLKPYITDTTALLQDSLLNHNARILLEGQLGALRDPDHGIYPYSTSSSTIAGFGAVGAGLPPYAITQIIAVTKAYSSCVGNGPFVSELAGDAANELRRRGGDAGEYGALTGRPRRVGWFDVVATRYGCRVQGATEVALTNLDVLGYLDEIPVCVAYEIDGSQTDSFPVSAQLDRAKPVLTTCTGWKTDISDVRDYDLLPPAARRYVEQLEAWIGVPIKTISVGPKREQLIRRRTGTF